MTPSLLSKSPAQLTGKPMTAPAATPASTSFITKPKTVAAKRAPKNLLESEDDYLKIMAYGPTGSGKTRIIVDLLEAGLTVLALSTDFGGNGFTSVQMELKRKNRADLLANCLFFEFSTYDEVEDFVFNPEGTWPEIYNNDIDAVFLDGFSGMQLCMLEDKVLGKESLFLDQQGWGRMKTGTTRVLNNFLALKNKKTGKSWHKFVVCHENYKPKEDKISGESRIGPMLQGAGAAIMEMAFDLIFRTRKKRDTVDGKKVTKYTYELEGTDSKILTKARGLEVPPTMDANFGVLWKSICEQKGFSAGKR